jgi:hypothetical protein
VSMLAEQLEGRHTVVGKVQTPCPSQSIAPQIGSVVSHRSLQQVPVPCAPQIPRTQPKSLVQGWPGAFWPTQAPLSQ